MIQSAWAQEAAGQAAQAAGLGPAMHQFIMIAMIVGVFYLLIIRPQQKQQKALRQMISEAKKGDEVMLESGLYGKINDIKDEVIMLQIANNTIVKVDRTKIVKIKGYDLPGQKPSKKAA